MKKTVSARVARLNGSGKQMSCELNQMAFGRLGNSGEKAKQGLSQMVSAMVFHLDGSGKQMAFEMIYH
jgi:hypothetical protein